MEFQLYDHSTNTRTVVVADGDTMTIGRDESCSIVLKSPFVARHHAQIVRRGNQLFVEAVSRAGTSVANREVVMDRPMPLDFGDEIQIGQFSLAAIGRDRASATKNQQAQQQNKLMEFERQVHAELLERMNLRVTGKINKADAGFIHQMLAQLDTIIAQRTSDLEKATVRHTLATHLHRLVRPQSYSLRPLSL